MKSYKNRSRRKTTGEIIQLLWRVLCIVLDVDHLTCILSVIAAEYGYFSVHASTFGI